LDEHSGPVKNGADPNEDTEPEGGVADALPFSVFFLHLSLD